MILRINLLAGIPLKCLMLHHALINLAGVVSFSGKFIDVTTYGDAKEERFALDALYSRHPTMEGWGQVRHIPTISSIDSTVYKHI